MNAISRPSIGATGRGSNRVRNPANSILVKIEPDGGTVCVVGRDAWALKALMRAGSSGCTPIDTPGPRWSHYVWKLRGLGIVVETINEAHEGAFPGHHARYVLHTQVSIVRDTMGRAAA